MARLEKSEMLLDKGAVDSSGVTFVSSGVVSDTLVTIPFEKYDDMGKPDVITVTVQPGDHLNDGPEYRYRDNSTGMYVSKEIAEADPDNHTKETE